MPPPWLPKAGGVCCPKLFAGNVDCGTGGAPKLNDKAPDCAVLGILDDALVAAPPKENG